MKIAFYTFGCKVNQYETQALRQQFAIDVPPFALIPEEEGPGGKKAPQVAGDHDLRARGLRPAL